MSKMSNAPKPESLLSLKLHWSPAPDGRSPARPILSASWRWPWGPGPSGPYGDGLDVNQVASFEA
jgi:hypothetical protein